MMLSGATSVWMFDFFMPLPGFHSLVFPLGGLYCFVGFSVPGYLFGSQSHLFPNFITFRPMMN